MAGSISRATALNSPSPTASQRTDPVKSDVSAAGNAWSRSQEAPRLEDDNSAEIQARLAEKIPEWEAFDIVPSERFPEVSNDN